VPVGSSPLAHRRRRHCGCALAVTLLSHHTIGHEEKHSANRRKEYAMKRRSGFTLVELLVVIAIISVLVSMLVPAVQRIRAEADRTRCKNNLRQIGIALHLYHDRTGSFPPGYYSNSNPDGSDSGPGWGWAAYLLDDLEQDPLQKQIDFTRDISDPVNAAARTTVLPIYLCPANPAATTFTVNDANGQPLCDVARGSYIAVNGNDGVSDHAADNDGAFVRNQRSN